MSTQILRAQTMSSVSVADDHCTATAWTNFFIGGTLLDHPTPARHVGFACANFGDAPFDACDVKVWARNEALRLARARHAKQVACIVNRFRKGRLLVTHDERAEYFRFRQSEYWRRQRPLMSPEGEEQKGLNHNQLDLIVASENEQRGPIPSLESWVAQRRSAVSGVAA